VKPTRLARLRQFVLLALLFNLVYFLWAEDLLRGAGFGPKVQREPLRLERQINPQAVKIQKIDLQFPGDAALASAEGPCLQSDPLEQGKASLLRQSVSPLLPPEAWAMTPATLPARWIIYIGQYYSPLTIASKRAELAALNITVEALTNPELELGLSLGHFTSQSAAATALEALKKRGLRKALVVQERPEALGAVMRVRLSDAALQSKLDSLGAELANTGWQPCS
jgi:hypothetical protein